MQRGGRACSNFHRWLASRPPPSWLLSACLLTWQHVAHHLPPSFHMACFSLPRHKGLCQHPRPTTPCCLPACPCVQGIAHDLSVGLPHAVFTLFIKVLCQHRLPDMELVLSVTDRARAFTKDGLAPVFSWSKTVAHYDILYPYWQVRAPHPPRRVPVTACELPRCRLPRCQLHAHPDWSAGMQLRANSERPCPAP